MKKIYIIPNVIVVKVRPQQMIAESMAIGGETDIVESRRNDFFDDYDDEYED